MNSLKKSYVIGNWKMHGSKPLIQQFQSELAASLPPLAERWNSVEVVLCPPSVYLATLHNVLQEMAENLGFAWRLGAQNAYCENAGAFTGEISPGMLADLGCQYVLIGHSERRQLFAESDALIARKWLAAYDAGLLPILCIGETEAERALDKTYKVIDCQLASVFGAGLPQALTTLCIAYEPVWAIGTGLTAMPEEADNVHAYIRAWLDSRYPGLASQICILYGGSVKASNAEAFFRQPNIDGVLVGGASLQAKEFVKICQSAITGGSWNKLF